MTQSIRILAAEAFHTFRAGFRGPMFPLVYIGIFAYLAIVLVNAEALQDMGASNVPRNSANVVLLMTAGQAAWLLFAWAWLFSRAVTRDQDANLHEVVLAAPVSLPQLMVARYLGTVGVAALLGSAMPLAFLIVHPMAAAGVFDADAVGPVPWAAMAHGWVLFPVVSAAGLGALYLTIALRTRNAAGPFALAAVLIGVWMASMIVLRGGHIEVELASVVDPTGYAEVEAQADAWTPAEKVRRLLAPTLPLVLNRALWGLLPLAVFALAISRLRRESLACAQGSGRRASAPRRVDERSAANASPGPAEAPSWTRATLLEASWHLKRSFRSWTTALAGGLLFAVGIGGPFVHIVGHAEGPLVPRPELLTPLLAEFMYLMLVFVVAGFVGVLMRRDELPGFEDVADAAPAPLGTRLVGRTLAAMSLTAGLGLIPVASGYALIALTGTPSPDLSVPLFYGILVYVPALLEVCVATILVHALIRRAGGAHAVAMLVVFVMVLNSDLRLTTYPPAKVGLPFTVTFSELVGLAPWWSSVIAEAAFKWSVCLLGVAAAWIVWPRGRVDRGSERFRQVWHRIRGRGGALGGLALVAVGITGWFLHEQLVVRGDYTSASAARASDAAWERHWFAGAGSFEVSGGRVAIELDPTERQAYARWHLQDVRSRGARIQAELPPGTSIVAATVNGQPTPVDANEDHAAVTLGPCAAQEGCEVVLDIKATRTGWPADGTTPWIDRSYVWMTADDVLPRLGVDPERALRAPARRREQGLPIRAPSVAARAMVSAAGVAPPGQWSYTVVVRKAGWSTSSEGQIHGPMDFAFVWRPDAPSRLERGGVPAWHGPSHRAAAEQIIVDVREVHHCASTLTGWELPRPAEIVQAPRGDSLDLHAGLLWLPEDQGWDVEAEGLGRHARRWTLGRLVVSAYLAERAALRREPGSRWLQHGVAGWVALECVRRLDGEGVWSALVTRMSERIVQAFGSLSAPVESLSDAGDARWVEDYAPLTVFGWAHTVGTSRALEVVTSVLTAVRGGAVLHDALADALSTEDAAELLGPPLASDLSVGDAALSGEVLARRWRWSSGAWAEETRPASSVLLLSGASVRPITLGADLPDHGFIVLDARPAFERSMRDNVRPSSSEANGD
ncbi:MAG: hypothetical protein AAGF12_18395 [Myxococcota bacterium]